MLAVVLSACVSLVQASRLKVYLLGGQSNMADAGAANDLPPELQEPQTDVLIYPGYYHNVYQGGSWEYLQPNLRNIYFFGPEVTFGRAIADAQPGENIALIKYSLGATNLWEEWRSPNTGRGPAGPQYVAFMNTVTDALVSLEANYEPEIMGMIWMQGDNAILEWDKTARFVAGIFGVGVSLASGYFIDKGLIALLKAEHWPTSKI